MCFHLNKHLHQCYIILLGYFPPDLCQVVDVLCNGSLMLWGWIKYFIWLVIIWNYICKAWSSWFPILLRTLTESEWWYWVLSEDAALVIMNWVHYGLDLRMTERKVWTRHLTRCSLDLSWHEKVSLWLSEVWILKFQHLKFQRE